MAKREPLALHEEVLLLALHDETGRIVPGTPYASAMAGAILAELAWRGRIAMDASGEGHVVRVADPAPVGDPLLDDCLRQLGAAERPESPRAWIGRFTSLPELKDRAARRLVERGILREEEDGVLLFFTRRGYPAVDMEPEREVVERLRRAIFTDAAEVEPRTLVLLSLARSAGLLWRVFPVADLRAREERIAKLVSCETLDRTMREVVEAADGSVAAIIAAVNCATIG